MALALILDLFLGIRQVLSFLVFDKHTELIVIKLLLRPNSFHLYFHFGILNYGYCCIIGVIFGTYASGHLLQFNFSFSHSFLIHSCNHSVPQLYQACCLTWTTDGQTLPSADSSKHCQLMKKGVHLFVLKVVVFLPLFIATGMDLEIIILREVSQRHIPYDIT